MILYHGSNVIVQEPQILENGFYKDFGYVFTKISATDFTVQL